MSALAQRCRQAPAKAQSHKKVATKAQSHKKVGASAPPQKRSRKKPLTVKYIERDYHQEWAQRLAYEDSQRQAQSQMRAHEEAQTREHDRVLYARMVQSRARNRAYAETQSRPSQKLAYVSVQKSFRLGSWLKATCMAILSQVSYCVQWVCQCCLPQSQKVNYQPQISRKAGFLMLALSVGLCSSSFLMTMACRIFALVVFRSVITYCVVKSYHQRPQWSIFMPYNRMYSNDNDGDDDDNGCEPWVVASSSLIGSSATLVFIVVEATRLGLSVIGMPVGVMCVWMLITLSPVPPFEGDRVFLSNSNYWKRNSCQYYFLMIIYILVLVGSVIVLSLITRNY